MSNAAGALSAVITSYKVPQQGTYKLVASYGKVKAEVSIDIGKSRPAPQDKGLKNYDVKKYICVSVTKPNAVSKYMTD